MPSEAICPKPPGAKTLALEGAQVALSPFATLGACCMNSIAQRLWRVQLIVRAQRFWEDCQALSLATPRNAAVLLSRIADLVTSPESQRGD